MAMCVCIYFSIRLKIIMSLEMGLASLKVGIKFIKRGCECNANSD